MLKIIFFCVLFFASGQLCLAQDFTFLPEDKKEEPVSYFSPEKDKPKKGNINYRNLFIQSSVALGIQHSLRFTQEKTRVELGGPFVKDWFKSVRSISGWHDGDSFLANGVGHPMMGATAAFIFAQNDEVSKGAKFGWNKEYFRAKKRQFIFAVIYSEQFEIGPISESSVGNVGIHGEGHGIVDHVITPVVGILMSVAEDAIDVKIIRPVMKEHKIVGGALALFLNPNRSSAKILAWKWPWHRE